jgi:REP element-mobilizing transposase RayT
VRFIGLWPTYEILLILSNTLKTMSEYRKTSPENLYFLTLTVEGWVDVFTRKEYKDILVQNLAHCQKQEGLEIYCYVIMSNHLHMIARRERADLAELMGRFKSFTAKKLLEAIDEHPQESRKEWLGYLFQHFAKKNTQYSKHHFWHYSNHPTHLYSDEAILQKEKYIHDNPVRAGLVLEDWHWLYSSACPLSPLKTLAWC